MFSSFVTVIPHAAVRHTATVQMKMSRCLYTAESPIRRFSVACYLDRPIVLDEIAPVT